MVLGARLVMSIDRTCQWSQRMSAFEGYEAIFLGDLSRRSAKKNFPGASALRTGVLLPPEDGLRQMIG
jgi:hypothetical protein